METCNLGFQYEVMRYVSCGKRLSDFASKEPQVESLKRGPLKRVGMGLARDT